jgi:transmembrane sensor
VPLNEPIKLSAGEMVRIATNGHQPAVKNLTVEHNSSANVGQWLVFHDEPLADIVAKFNRYNAEQIVVEGATTGKQHFSGAFDAHDPSSFLKFLSCCSRLTVSHQPNRTVIRLPPD